MTKDQLGLVKCSEIVRVVKRWLRDARKDSSAFWETVADFGVQALQSIKQGLSRALLVLDASARTIRILPETVKLAAQLVESDQRERDRHHERSDLELHFNLRVRIGSPETLPSDTSKASAGKRNVKFRLGVHPPGDDESKFSSLFAAQDESVNSDEMTVSVDLGLRHEMGGKCGLGLSPANKAADGAKADATHVLCAHWQMTKPWTSRPQWSRS